MLGTLYWSLVWDTKLTISRDRGLYRWESEKNAKATKKERGRSNEGKKLLSRFVQMAHTHKIHILIRNFSEKFQRNIDNSIISNMKSNAERIQYWNRCYLKVFYNVPLPIASCLPTSVFFSLLLDAYPRISSRLLFMTFVFTMIFYDFCYNSFFSISPTASESQFFAPFVTHHKKKIGHRVISMMAGITDNNNHQKETFFFFSKSLLLILCTM